MNRKRIAAAALCVALSLPAAGGLAATSKVNTKQVPSVKTITLSHTKAGNNRGGTQTFLTVNAVTPGFLYLYIEDDMGNIIRTLADHKEIHGGDTVINFQILDDNGDVIPEGTYRIVGTMVSQYGVESDKAKEISFNVGPATAAFKDAETSSLTAPVAATSADGSTMLAGLGTVTGSSDGTAASADGTTGGPLTAVSAEPISSGVSTTVASGLPTGEEGLQIGVGPSDSAPGDNTFWSLTADATDEQIWAAITAPMTVVNTGTSETDTATVFSSTGSDKTKLGTVSGLAQGLHVITERSDGYSLVEAYRNEDGAFIRGYIKTKSLKQSEPNTHYGIVINKKTQILTIYKDGARIGSCYVCTGLAIPDHLNRETPAGEFITLTRRGTIEYGTSGYCKDTVRINGNYHLCEIPTTKKNGNDYKLLSGKLGTKATRGNICIQHDASTDGAISADLIWNLTNTEKRIRVLIIDDKERNEIPSAS